MRYIIILLLACSLATIPAVSHGFGLLKYLGDAVANQLGIDRGPLPKVSPKPRDLTCDPYLKRLPKHIYFQNWHLQAQGY